jgi:hypothetical protein
LAGQLWLGLELVIFGAKILWQAFFVVSAENSYLNLAESREPFSAVHGPGLIYFAKVRGIVFTPSAKNLRN